MPPAAASVPACGRLGAARRPPTGEGPSPAAPGQPPAHPQSGHRPSFITLRRAAAAEDVASRRSCCFWWCLIGIQASAHPRTTTAAGGGAQRHSSSTFDNMI
ncbi:uncharacterized protein LOC120710587 [Panicum virgatum]|uniref:uncharacterized protein LOC120710587 n=1 Tax=Panicum virgatum TaxID=38727 RepID=UPI0019D5E66D|nr:uncharacterized protein LOC120710587 [Panicum virgatum]